MEKDLLKCIVDDRPMYFHRWCDEADVIAPSPLKGGHLGGTVRHTYAIVEDAEDGQVSKVLPEEVKFVRSSGTGNI